MIDVFFEIGGKKVKPDQVGNALEKAVFQRVTESVKEALSSVQCSEHGERPTVIVKGKTIDKISFEIRGCCQSLIDRTLKKLN